MRFAALIAVVSVCDGAAVVDPCTRLCKFDGPTVCTGGSWTKGAGICHAYFHNAQGHCYHSALTRDTCPSSGRPVRADEVDGLINLPRAQASTTTMQPRTTRGGPITSTFAPDRAIVYTPMPIMAKDTDASKIGLQIEPQYLGMVREILRLHDFDFSYANSWSDSMHLIQAGSRALQMAGRIEDPVALFKRLRGHLLLAFVKEKTAPLLLREALTMAMSFPVMEKDLNRFIIETGLSAFCKETLVDIRDMALEFIRAVRTRPKLPTMGNVIMEAFAVSELSRFCPQVIDQHPEVRMAVVAARAYRSLLTETRITGYIIALELEGISRRNPFTDAAGHIMKRDPRTLRLPVQSVQFANEYNADRIHASREFLYLAGREITTILFREGGSFALPGPLDLYEAAGRLVAMAMINGVYLGISLPALYRAELVGQPVTAAEILEDFPEFEGDMSETFQSLFLKGEVEPLLGQHQRRELFVRGFHSVIPASMMENVTSQQLGDMLRGSTVRELFESMDVAEYFAQGVNNQRMTWLREYLESLNPERFQRLMTMVTGMHVFPVGGFRGLYRFPALNFPIRTDFGYVDSIQMSNGELMIPEFATREEMFRALDEFLRRS